MNQSTNNIKSWLCNNLLTIITTLYLAFAGVCICIWNRLQNKFTILDIILIVLLIIQSTVVISYAIWRKLSYKSYYYPASKIKPEFIILEKIVNYEVVEILIPSKNNKKAKVEYELKFSNKRTIKCCVDHIKTIQGKYIWTGKQSASLPIAEAHEHIRSIESSKGIWNYYDITFDDCILRGETKVINNTFPNIKDCKSSRPFVASSTEEPTKRLIFNINLGREYANKEVTIETFRSNDSCYPLSKKEMHFDKEGKLYYTITKPKRFRYYVVSWTW